MQAEINTLTSIYAYQGLTELITLGRLLKRRAIWPTSIIPTPATVTTEAINGRLNTTRIALGLAKPHQHITRNSSSKSQTPTTHSMKEPNRALRDDDCGAPKYDAL